MSDGQNDPNAVPAPAPPMTQTMQIQLGEALINPQWRGHLIALADNGGDLVYLIITHPRHGEISILWPRNQAANLRDWLSLALQAPVLTPMPVLEPEVQAIDLGKSLKN